jgi:maleylpyruvate isomerase
MKLHSYFRSSAAYRLRIALNLKGLDYEQVPVSLVKGEQLSEQFMHKNPQGLVPVLEDGSLLLTQSLAICEYLDEIYPQPSLLPETPVERARVRALALAIACEIHPLNNLRVLKYLKRLGQDEEQRSAWYRHWVGEGLAAVEAMLAGHPQTGRFCHGDLPGLADLFLVPQVANAGRYDCPLEGYPTVRRIYEACLALPPFERAQPHLQPDAV